MRFTKKYPDSDTDIPTLQKWFAEDIKAAQLLHQHRGTAKRTLKRFATDEEARLGTRLFTPQGCKVRRLSAGLATPSTESTAWVPTGSS